MKKSGENTGKKRTALEIVGIIAIISSSVFLARDIYELISKYKKSRSDINEAARKQISSKKQRRAEMVKNTLEHNMNLFEERMLAHGAVMRDDFDVENREKFGMRSIYEYQDKFFRIGTLVFDEGEDPYIIVNAIDNERYARIGIMEEIEAYPYDMPEARIDEVVKEYLESEL
ncbi:MAG: hypothetical protein IKQ97_00905 [Eubacterium sp.]|nr:hypothetical protein [Eubacterium sp.]